MAIDRLSITHLGLQVEQSIHVGGDRATPIVNAVNAWAVSYEGTILKWDGTSWSAQILPEDMKGEKLAAVWGSDACDAWAVSSDRERTLNGTGSPGRPQDLPKGTEKNNLNCVWGIDTNHVWAVGDGGTILKWDGSTWRFKKVARKKVSLICGERTPTTSGP